MKKMLKGYVIYSMDSWNDEPRFELWSFDVSIADPNYALVSINEFEIEIPGDFDPRPQQIKNLREQKEKILAETQMKVHNIEEQIQRLLCIEHKT